MTVSLIGWQAAGGIAAQVADVSVSDQVDLIVGGQPEPEQEDKEARFRSLLRGVYEELPEGATVAQALEEITYRMRTAGQPEPADQEADAEE